MLTPPPGAYGQARFGLPTLADAWLALATLVTLTLSLQFSDDLTCALINVGLVALPFSLMLSLGGRLRVALAAASVFAVLVWGVGELKLRFFGERLGLLDFYFLSSGSNWSIVKRYPEIQHALAGFLLLCLSLGWAAYRGERGRRALGLRARGLSAVLLVLWCSNAFSQRQHHLWEVFREDADCGADKICGVMARLVYSYGAFEFIPPPTASDSTAFQRAAQQLPPRIDVGAKGAIAQRPDVLVWLHESTLDPTQYRLDGAQLPVFSMFSRTENTRASGLLRVHTYGGRTWLSEFSVLTGLLPTDFGVRRNLVFNSVAPEVSSTLVHRFEAAGYETVALMPTSRAFYGAARTYTAIGFDRVLTLRDFPQFDDVPGDEWEISDSPRMAEAAVALLQKHRRRDNARPLFIYMLSIREHAPYFDTTEIAYGLDRTGVSRALAAKLTDYVDRLRQLDAATVTLERELNDPGWPAVWAYFGDHQANFGEDSPGYRHALADPEHITQYQLRANHGVPITDSPALLDIALLPSLIADAAGAPADAYFKAQSAMRRLCAGALRDCPQQALVESYKGYVFDPALALFAPTSAGEVQRAAR